MDDVALMTAGIEALRVLRAEAAATIERLLRFLDETDDAADCEDDEREPDVDDEPSIGFDTCMEAREEDSADEECGGDPEPSIGFDKGCEAREEDMADDEPSLGWTIDGVHGGGEQYVDAEICPKAKLVKRLPNAKRLDNVRLKESLFAPSSIERGKPRSNSICNIEMPDGSPATLENIRAVGCIRVP